MWSEPMSPSLKADLSTPLSAANIRVAVAGANFSASFDLIADVWAKSSAHHGRLSSVASGETSVAMIRSAARWVRREPGLRLAR